MWEISNTAQIFTFMYSICLGIIFCVFYDVFRSLRKSIKFSSIVIFFQDILYFFIISIITFIFLLSLTNGEIRGFVIFGILIGFLLCYFTFSKILLKFLSQIFRFLIIFFGKTNSILNLAFCKVYIFLSKFLKNIQNTYKKCLKKVKGLLYTKK